MPTGFDAVERADDGNGTAGARLRIVRRTGSERQALCGTRRKFVQDLVEPATAS